MCQFICKSNNALYTSPKLNYIYHMCLHGMPQLALHRISATRTATYVSICVVVCGAVVCLGKVTSHIFTRSSSPRKRRCVLTRICCNKIKVSSHASAVFTNNLMMHSSKACVCICTYKCKHKHAHI